jgi:hypothetical protein
MVGMAGIAGANQSPVFFIFLVTSPSIWRYYLLLYRMICWNARRGDGGRTIVY